ncbi:MAG: DUF2156 domain-containing protein [Candidatus Saccharicenans sp.]
MIPEYPELKPVELTDREEVNRYLERFPPEICELTFANIFIWRHWEKPRLSRINGNLCVLCSPPDEEPYFLEPVGENSLDETVSICLTLAPRLSRLSERFLNKLKGSYSIKEDQNNFDYVYLTKELAELSGKKYDGKRNWIRKFEKKYDYLIKPIETADIPSCLSLVEQWGEASPAQEQVMDDRTRATVKAIEEALNNFVLFGLSAMVVVIDGQVKGFCLGEKLNPETAVVHVELASREISGLYQFLNRECARTIWKEFAYINREQDAGIPGLRRSKLSYQPHHFINKYDLTRQ